CSESGGIGFSVQTNDQFDALNNSCGIFEAALHVDDTEQFNMKIDRIPFEHTRYINSHMDHAEFQKGNDFHRLYRAEGNPLGIYSPGKNGILKIKPGDKKNIAIQVNDYSENKSELKFTLKVAAGQLSGGTGFSSEVYFMPNEKISVGGASETAASFELAPNALYFPLQKDFNAEKPIRLGRCNVPVQKELRIRIPSNRIPQAFLEVCTEKGGTSAKEVFYTQGHYIASPRNLGTYTLKTDREPPKLNYNGIKNGVISWSVHEETTELADYDLFIDGKWVLLEYESKRDLLFARIPPGSQGNSNAEIIVYDLVGNEQTSKVSITNK
ncbi:MAG: hypothetical protein ACK45H_04615, partial [Bacteroidota bacterium]